MFATFYHDQTSIPSVERFSLFIPLFLVYLNCMTVPNCLTKKIAKQSVWHLSLRSVPSDTLKLCMSRLPLQISKTLEVRYGIGINHRIGWGYILAAQSLLDGSLDFLAVNSSGYLRHLNDEAWYMSINTISNVPCPENAHGFLPRR